ncbi:MAG: hypothetical protein IJ746_07760 [Ruminococcus sp.]|nr:hypothetical protein [Ruminococcus sp.]
MIRLTKGKAHFISLSVIVGVNAAAYIQGNFMTIGAHVLDGTEYSASVARVIIDLLIWAALIALPFVIYLKAKDAYKWFVIILSGAVIIIEMTAIISDVVNATNNSLDLVFSNKSYVLSCATENEFTFSKEKNHIVIIVDQYDSFIYDNAVSQEPDSVSGFDGFTYYDNTIGMYQFTDPSIAYLFTNELIGKDEPMAEHFKKNDILFKHIPEDYRVEFYCDNNFFPYEVSQASSDNFVEHSLSLGDYARISSTLYDMVLFRVVPDIAKAPFMMYSGDLVAKLSSLGSYQSDNLVFYRSLPQNVQYTEDPCYKLFYLKGVHVPRNTNKDIERDSDVSPTDSAIGVNKILSAFFELLKEGGVYDNSDIILLADHGHRPNYDAKYPLLMIKRARDMDKGIKTSSVQVSYADFFPTCCYLLGDESMKDKSIFEIPEGQKRDRYFAALDEHTTEDVDRTLPLDESGL